MGYNVGRPELAGVKNNKNRKERKMKNNTTTTTTTTTMICPLGTRLPEIGEACATFPHLGNNTTHKSGDYVQYNSEGQKKMTGIVFISDERGLFRVA